MITCAFPESRTSSVADPARLELLQLLDEDARVDDAAGADHALLAPEDPRGHVPRLVGLAVDDDRVPGVRPAVVAADEIRVLGKQVDDLALALVAPLGADDHGRGHAESMPPGLSGLQERLASGRLARSRAMRRTRMRCPRRQVVKPTSASARSDPSTTVSRPAAARRRPRGTPRRARRRRSHPLRARSPDERPSAPVLLYAGARSANLAKRRRNESLTMSVGPFRCFARCSSASPC